MRNNDEYNELLEQCLKIAEGTECINHAQIIAASDLSHSLYYKRGLNRDTAIIDLIKKNKKKHQRNLLKKAVELISQHRIYQATEIASLLGIHYDTFKEGIGASKEVKQAVTQAKMSIKLELREKMLASKNSTDNIALYKLIGTKDEVDRLNGSTKHIDITSGGKPIIQPMIVAVTDNDEEE